MYSWFSFTAPAGTPKEIVEKLNNAFGAVIKDSASQEAIKKLGFQSPYKGPAEFKQFMASEYGRYNRIAKEGGIAVK
jgi:tripartite-type tricarboxylate transporter receptor subunit TctC